MSVNIPAAINRVFQEFNTALLAAFQNATTACDAYAMEVPSSARSTMHAWLVDQAMPREWKGKRVLNSMGARYWEVINRNWELSYGFEVNQILDDLEGLVTAALMRARGDGVKWARAKDQLCAAALEAGVSSLCFDGQFFFDTDHPVDQEGLTSGTYVNMFTNAPLGFGTFDQAVTQMHSFKLEDGSPMVPPGTKLHLIHPPGLRLKANQICKQASLTPAAAYGLYGTSGPSDNPFVNMAEPIENAWLTNAADWYLTAEDAGGVIKPIMFQRRQDVQTDEQGVGSALYFDEKKVAIGMDARYEASYTFPQLAIFNRAT
jgi:phage major head subunit gpT-like protein